MLTNYDCIANEHHVSLSFFIFKSCLAYFANLYFCTIQFMIVEQLYSGSLADWTGSSSMGGEFLYSFSSMCFGHIIPPSYLAFALASAFFALRSFFLSFLLSCSVRSTSSRTTSFAASFFRMPSFKRRV